jgi:hypothetical protein
LKYCKMLHFGMEFSKLINVTCFIGPSVNWLLN